MSCEQRTTYITARLDEFTRQLSASAPDVGRLLDEAIEHGIDPDVLAAAVRRLPPASKAAAEQLIGDILELAARSASLGEALRKFLDAQEPPTPG